jgi:hypothetical protein
VGLVSKGKGRSEVGSEVLGFSPQIRSFPMSCLNVVLI